MTKASYTKEENVELVLIFDEPGGIDLNGTYVHFSYENSPTPVSTNVYSAWIRIGDCVFTNATSTYCSSMSQSYYAVKVSIPVAKDGHDYFMSGTYEFDSMFTRDLSNNNAVYGIETDGISGGADIPGEVMFTVDNPGADLIAPVVKSISISPAEAKAGDIVTVDVTAYDPDGISDIGVTFWCNDFQFYPQELFQISEVGADGMTSMRLTMTLPENMKPGQYHFGQFGIQDKRMNLNCQTSLHPIIENFDEFGFSVTNDSYVEPGIPIIDEFLMSKQSAKPGEDVTFRVKITENGAEIEDDCYLRAGHGGVTLFRQPDGYYTGTLRIPANWIEQEIHFGMLIYYTDGGNYQFYFSEQGSELNPILRIGSVFSGLDDVTVLKGSDDILTGVTACNDLEQDMTSRITVANPPDFSVPGVYFVRYEIASEVGQPDSSNTYIGYRWVGVTEQLPDSADDPFVVAADRLVVDASENDVSVEENLGDGGFHDVNLSNEYTAVGTYRLTKLNYDGGAALASPANRTAANGQQLICSVINAESRSYTIAFHPNGGTGSTMASIPMTYGVAKTLPASTFTRTGYTFAGWALSPASSVKYVDMASVNNLATGGSVTLYAKWAPKKYTVTFNSQGGSAVASKKVESGTVVAPPIAPTKAGFVFAGWYKEAACTTPWNFTTDKVNANTTLYARWNAAARYTVAVQTNNVKYGTVSGGGSYYNDNVTKATIVATPKAGYRFVRWLAGSSAISASYKYSFLVTKARTLTAEFAKIGTPTISAAASVGYNSIKLTWTAVTGAAGYEIYRSASSGGTYSKIKTVTGVTTFTNTGLTTNKTYYYKVKAYCVAGSVKTYGSLSVYKSSKPIPATPTITATSASYSSARVTWGAIAGASGYEVCRATASNGTYTKIYTATSGTTVSYTNKGLTTNKTYYYKVRAYRLVGATKVYGNYSVVKSTKPVPASPTGANAARVSATSIKISWSAVAGATKYEVYRATASGGTYALVTTTSSLSWANTGLTTGKTYYYKLRAYRLVGTTKVYGGYSAVVSAKP